MADNSKPWREVAKERLLTERDRLQKELINDGTDPNSPKGSLVRQIEVETERDKTYSLHPRWYWGIVIAYLVLQIALFVAGAFILKPTEMFSGVAIYPGLVIWILQGIHLIDSLKRIDVEDLAGIDFFGRPIYLPKTGLYLVPRFLLTLTRAIRNYKDVRYPGPADKIYRVSEELMRTLPGGDMPPVEGQVRPIFVTTGEPKLSPEDLKEMQKDNWNPLDKQQNIEIAYFVRYRPHEGNGGIFRIIRNVGGIRGNNPEETQRVIENLLQEQSERDMKAIITQQTYATVVENWDLVNEVFALRLQASVLRLGLQIDPRGGGLDDANPSRATNSAQADARRAEFERQKTITAADAEKQRLTREGEGRAAAELAMLNARAKGYENIKNKAGVSGQVAVAADVIASFDKSRSTVFGAQGVKEIMATIPGASAIFDGDGKAPPPSSTTPPASPAAKP